MWMRPDDLESVPFHFSPPKGSEAITFRNRLSVLTSLPMMLTRRIVVATALCLLPSQVNALTALAKCLSGYEWVCSSFHFKDYDLVFFVRCSVRQARVLAMLQWSSLLPALAQVSLPSFLCSMFVQTLGNLAYQVGPLLPGYLYSGPFLGYINGCLCSSVYYSLLNACAFCQGQGIETWILFQTISPIVAQDLWFYLGGQIIFTIVLGQWHTFQSKPVFHSALHKVDFP